MLLHCNWSLNFKYYTCANKCICEQFHKPPSFVATESLSTDTTSEEADIVTGGVGTDWLTTGTDFSVSSL